jgi:predicted ATP-dependent serine protease
VIKENGIPIGELRTDWYYVVSVGSYVIPNEHSCGDGTYRLSGECREINKFNGLPEILRRDEVKTKEIKTFNKQEPEPVSIKKYEVSIEQKGKQRVKRK